MTKGPYRVPAEIEPEPTALDELLARARVRRGSRSPPPFEEEMPERAPLTLLPDLLLVSLVVLPLLFSVCGLYLFVRAHSVPTRVEWFCRAVPAGEPASSLAKRAAAEGFGVVHPRGSSKYVVLGDRGLSGGDFCRVHVSGGNVTRATYAGSRIP